MLDYVLVTRSLHDEVLRMGVDEGLELFTGSDHVAVRVDVRIPTTSADPHPPKAKSIRLRGDRDLKLAQDIMDREIDKVDWKSLSLDEKGESVQRILVAANVEAYGTNPLKRKPRRNKDLKRLQSQRRGAAKE